MTTDPRPTLASTRRLYALDDPQLLEELHEYRIEYELLHGPTDTNCIYSSTLPRREQELLIKNEPRKYFEGLPPFVKAFQREYCCIDLMKGRGDLIPPGLLEIYVEERMGRRFGPTTPHLGEPG